MGKITVIKKSRKECTCGKCRKIIPVGSSYLRGTLNFHPDIIRCTDCGLKGWEVTTSEYLLTVGPIIYEWQERGYDLEGIKDELTNLRDELQDRLDNMPEQLQYSETAELLQERIDGLEAAVDSLEEIDYDTLFSDKMEELIDREGANENNLTDEEREEVQTAADEEVASQIDEALANIVE